MEHKNSHLKTVEYELRIKTQDLEQTQAQLLESKLNHNEAVKKNMRSEAACERKENELQNAKEQLESLSRKSNETIEELKREI